MRKILSAASVAAVLWLAIAEAQTTVKKAPAKTPATAAKAPAKALVATKKGVVTPARKGTAASAGSAHRSGTPTRTAARKSAPKQPATTWRNRQLAPSPDRYKEIQTALVARGYLREEDATGVWNQNSMDALKRFQTEQNIESSGKINSLSLIALGLGPKRDNAPVVPPKPQEAQTSREAVR